MEALTEVWHGSYVSCALLIALALIVVVVGRVRAGRTKNVTSTDKETNEPPTLPGTLSEFFSRFVGSDGPEYFLQVSKSMGESSFKVPSTSPLLRLPDMFVTTDYRVARTVLEDPTSSKWERAIQFFVDTTNGINFVAVEGERWKHVRKSTSAAFSGPNVKLMVQSIETIMDKWIQDTLEPAIQHSRDIDILGEMNKITSKVITNVAFDYDLTDQEREVTLENLETCWTEFGQKAPTNLLRQLTLTRWMYPGIRKGKRASKEMYDLCHKMLNEYRQKEDKKPHKIVHMIAYDEEYANDAERIRDMVAFVIAGFDTTANTLAFCLLELARHPQEQTKLRSALRACSSKEEARNCPAVKRVVREILRMYPAAAIGSLRMTSKDVAVPSSSGETEERVIPSGSLVLTPYYAIQRNEQVYPNANDFVPSRWENPSKDAMRCLMTFSAGRRNCQGQALANAELNEVISRLCGKFEFHVVKEGQFVNLVLYKPVGTLLSAKVAV